MTELPEHREIIEECHRYFLGDFESGKQKAFGVGAHDHDPEWVQWSSRSTLDQLYRCVESGEIPGKARLAQFVRDDVYKLHRERYGAIGIIAWLRIAWLVGQVVGWLIQRISKGHTSLGMAMRSRNRG